MLDKLSAPLDDFKEREIEIINLMAEGYSNQEIADNLFITKETVRWYNKQIYSKLGTSRRTEAIALAREFGLIRDTPDEISQHIQHKLPITSGPFIGRDAELAELSDLLQNPDVRLLSIIATGGMGKSRISLELGHLIKGDYEHGAVFIDLSAIRNPDDIARFTLESLGVNLQDEQQSENALFDYCREKEILLIFDNFEHVLSGASFLSDLLEIAPRILIIATSRERLNLRVETVFYLHPIIDHADTLFIEVAGMMRPNIEITEAEHEDIQKIVELVGGLPLALVLAATWIDTLSVPEIAEEIESNLDFLSAEMGDMPERQRSIHAVIDPTWKRLKDNEQVAFMKASVFRGGFTRELFQQVTGGSIRTLQTLLSRSLIAHGYGRRYTMHPLLRQYAREKLEAHQLVDEAKKGHLESYLAYAQNENERMFTGNYLESLDALDIEQDNFRAALDWSLQGNEIDTGVSLLLSLCRFWSIRSQSFLAKNYLEQALQHRQTASLYTELGGFQGRLGQTETIIDNLQNGVSLAEQSGDAEVIATAYRRMGLNLYTELADKSLELLEQALELAQTTANQKLIADCYVSLGVTLEHEPGQLEMAIQYNQEALNRYEALDDLRGISMATYNLSLYYYKDKDKLQEARELCEQSLQIKYQIGDSAGAARRLSVLASWDILEEEFESAIERLDESMLICEELGEVGRLIFTLNLQGLLRIIMNDYAGAEDILKRGLELTVQSDDLYRMSDSCSYLVLLYLLQNRLAEAKPYLRQAIEIDAKVRKPRWLSIVAYANYLFYDKRFSDCLSLASVLHHHVDSYGTNFRLVSQYFARPLIYRIQQNQGDTAWQTALDDTSEIGIDEVFQMIVEHMRTE